jgi:hypothetical protein
VVWITFLFNRNLSESITYHYSDSLIWYLAWFIFPIAVSLLLAFKLESKLTRQIGTFLLPILILGTAIGGYLNHEYWGYVFRRPTVFTELKEAKTIVSISNIKKASNDEDFSTYTDTTLSKRLFGREDIYYGNLDRPIMVFLDRANMNGGLYDWHKVSIDSSKKVSPPILRQVSTLLVDSDLLVPPNEGYEGRGDRLTGRLIEFRTVDNREFFHASLKSGEVANDHYPYYEVLFQEDGSEIELVKSQHFFTDFAGYEGMEYSNMASMFEILALLSLGVIVMMVRGIRLILKKKKGYNTAS